VIVVDDIACRLSEAGGGHRAQLPTVPQGQPAATASVKWLAAFFNI
jgi:2-methylcitrate dehydratase PrpD